MSKLVLALGALIVLGASGCRESSEKTGTMTEQSTSASVTPAPSTAPATTSTPAAPALPGLPGTGKVHKLASGLQYDDLVVGSGKMAEAGMNVSIHYTGYLLDGSKFDSSLDRGEPLKFQVASGQMIQGFDEGVRGMRIGGKRKIQVPWSMAYGEAGRPPLIPPKSDLIFDMELLDVQ
jgi:FKBP-type peptidyl-prolyl cis-trans isomerase